MTDVKDYLNNNPEKKAKLDKIKKERESNVQQLRNYDYLDTASPLSYEEIIDSPAIPRPNILHPILPQQGWIFIYAKSGLGKTLFSLNLAYCIANGGSFLKYKAPNPKRVLYIDGEMSYQAMYERLIAIIEEQGKLEFPDNFYMYTPDKMLPKDSPKSAIPFPLPKICSQEGQEFYNRIIEKNKIDVIIFDNLSALSRHDESSAEEWYPIQDWFTHLKSIGKSVILIHHAGKNGEYRGTSRMLDTADTAICLKAIDEPLPNSEQKKIKRFKIEYEKHRNFDGDDSESYEVIFQDFKWSHQSIEISLIDKIIDCLNAKMTQRDIAKELLLSQSKVHRMIKQAKLTGRVKE